MLAEAAALELPYPEGLQNDPRVVELRNEAARLRVGQWVNGPVSELQLDGQWTTFPFQVNGD